VSQDRIAAHFQNSLDGLTRAVQSADLRTTTHTIARAVADALKAGNKLLLIGNGGSAADAQHIAAEIVGRYKQERPGWAAIALTTDTSALTAIANDYGFEQIFARQVQGLAKRGDVLFGSPHRAARRTFSLRSRWRATLASRQLVSRNQGREHANRVRSPLSSRRPTIRR
jgi:phosphoheptose isomerase